MISTLLARDRSLGLARPHWQSHAHNDYLHPRPLLDALDYGFASFEADIHLIDGELLVGHDRSQTRAGRTLESLYLHPLKERCRTNGGWVYPGHSRPVYLLVDIKADSQQVFPVLTNLLARYQSLLTTFTDTQTLPGAITVVLSGDRPIVQLSECKSRLCAIDGRPEDLDRNPSPHLVPWISSNWHPMFPHFEKDSIRESDRVALKKYVDRVHSQGRLVRFWGTTDREFAWEIFHQAGVDWINTDKLARLSAWLEKQSARP